MKQLFTLFLGLMLLSCGSTKTTTPERNHTFPDTVFGEWFDPSGNAEYNGVLIHPNFIENGYTAFMYNRISKTDPNQFEFTGKNNQGEIIPFALHVLNDNTITLQRGNTAKTTYIKQDHPKYAQRITMATVPNAIKGPWYTTNGENTLGFDINDNHFQFKGEQYAIDEIMHINEPDLEQYRFVVSNGAKSWMFYLKNWGDQHLQIGYNGQKGDLYKSNKSFAEPSSSLPKTVFGEWYNPSGNNEYDGVKIQPNFIEYMYTAYMFENIEKINDTDYRFTASSNDRTITGFLGFFNENTISLQRGYSDNATFIKKPLPHEAVPVTMAEVPADIKGSWRSTEGSNAVDFVVTDSQFKFRGQEYKVDEIMYVTDPLIEQYRFIVSTDQTTYMFYFKNWKSGLMQIGFDGMQGAFYQRQ